MQPCHEEDFILFQFPSVFNCYTFTRGRSPPLSTTAGIRAALSLTLFHEASDDSNVINIDYNKESTVDNGVGQSWLNHYILIFSCIDWLIDWLGSMLTDWLGGMLASWLTSWLADYLAGWLANWLTGWLASWLADCVCWFRNVGTVDATCCLLI